MTLRIHKYDREYITAIGRTYQVYRKNNNYGRQKSDNLHTPGFSHPSEEEFQG
jgi:hypothetical protein